MKSNQPTGGLPEDGDGKMPFLLLAVITIASLALSDMPVFSFIYSPIEYFTTALHEIGHALACSATGGSVSGMTIVSDGQGHGGLTFCQGGTHFIFGQTGYLGTTAFGCLLIIIGRHRSMTRPLLFLLAGLLTFAVFFYMMPALTMGNYAAQAMMSMVVGLVMAAALAAAGKWLPAPMAALLVMFLAVQTALNALYDILVLAQISIGMHGASAFTDATNMARDTGIPAFLWSLGWGLSSIVMLALTIKFAYGKSNK